MEIRQRPIELVEFCRTAGAAGVHPAEALRALVESWDDEGMGYVAVPADRAS